MTFPGLCNVEPQRRRETYLVLAIVLLRVAQHPVAEFKHVLKVRVTLIPQILQLQHGAVATLVSERSLEDTEDLGRQNPTSRLILC